jgi:peptidoglycan-N-acetylglucosamine deacetylase
VLPLVLGAAGVGAAAAIAGVSAIAPRSQLFGRTFIGRPGTKQLALTYDDGPNDPYTPQLLDVLAKHGVPATFFVIGKYVQMRPDLVRRIAAEGHEIGNHTYAHPNLAIHSRDRLFRELMQCEFALDAAGIRSPGSRVEREARLQASHGPSEVAPLAERIRGLDEFRAATGTKYFRPPWGARRPDILQMARAAGYETVMWSVMCYDWMENTAARIEQHAVRQIGTGGDVILLHDGNRLAFGADRSQSVQASDAIIARYKDQGFEFVTITEMMSG